MPSHLTKSTLGNQRNRPHLTMSHIKSSKTSSSTGQHTGVASKPFPHIARTERRLRPDEYLHTTGTSAVEVGLCVYGSYSSSSSSLSSSRCRWAYSEGSTIGTMGSIDAVARGESGTMMLKLASIDNWQLEVMWFGVQNCNYIWDGGMVSALRPRCVSWVSYGLCHHSKKLYFHIKH